MLNIDIPSANYPVLVIFVAPAAVAVVAIVTDVNGFRSK